MQQVVFDTECYKNFWMIAFKKLTGGVKYFELHDDQPLDVEGLREVLKSYELVSFNGIGYDIPMISLALSGASTSALKHASDRIIKENLKHWEFEKNYGVVFPRVTHIDLIEPAPGVGVSLKIYGGRMHSKKMQDLPIEPDADISPKDRKTLIKYCVNDLDTTKDLLLSIEDRLELRRKMSAQYGINLMSKSDAQIAEAVIKKEVEKLTDEKVRKSKVHTRTFNYEPPAFVKFKSEELNRILDLVKSEEFIAGSNGKITTTKGFDKTTVTIGNSTYKLGLGGIHSMESEKFHVEDAEFILRDWDVASYYPAIFLLLKLYPEAIGEHFLTVFKKIVDTRLEAKKNGDTLVADSMKIMINGTFGKTGSVYSILYAPNLLIQTTITGQLSLLMLIERMEQFGIHVVSANTDGIVLKCPRTHEKHMEAIIGGWEKHTGFTMEDTHYKALYSRDVNNYVAITTKLKVKTKGTFSPAGLQKNPTNEICSEAVIAFLKDGIPLEDTVRGCTDIRKFVSVRRVNGGAVKGEGYLGKAIRWYYSEGTSGTINYKTNGNIVPRSEGAKPLMQLPDEFPVDVDYDWYLKECGDLLMDLGVVERPIIPPFPRLNSKEWKRLLSEELVGLNEKGEKFWVSNNKTT